jgi:23S rRNA (pseudouridine1915-N3)-methyltransferase
MIRIVAVGKKHEGWVSDGIERYQKRLKKPFDVEWVLLPHSARTGLEARENESQAIFSRLKPDEYVVLLDETGKLLDSPALSGILLQQLESSRPVTIVIGGAFGVNNELKHRADLIWSLSPLVFPHQLVRLLVAEQLYRAQEIATGKPYHHE